jgi:hypothetical protein
MEIAAVSYEAACEVQIRAMWAKYLRENYRTAAHIAVQFGVTERTAMNWMEESVLPRMPVLVRALSDPAIAPKVRQALRLVA